MCAAGAFAQAPQITAGGVVNAASWSSPVSPGALAAVFGTNLAASTASAAPPYPTQLGGTTVTINGVAAPLVFVSPGQINFQMPQSVTDTAWFTIVSAQIVVTTTAGSNTPVTFAVGSMPGIFTADRSGCGQAAALNIQADGSVSVNSASNSAAPGDYIALYGTGLGFAAQQPPDGMGATGPANLSQMPGLLLNETTGVTPVYAGLAPMLAGVDQINFQIPAGTRNGCAVPVSASAGLASPQVTLAIQSGRGQCVDPPIQSYGQITLSHITVTGPAGTASAPAQDSFSAIFPAAPGLQPPTPEQVVFAPVYVANSSAVMPVLINGNVFLNNAPRDCAVPGYTHLSAGAIQIQGPGGAAAVNPVSINSTIEGVAYAQTLASGFVEPGKFTIAGPLGAAVSLNTTLQVGSPIQLQTTFAPGATISSSQPLTIQWTGGDASSLVRLQLCTTTCDYTYAHATDGSITISPFCTGHSVGSGGNGVVCSFGIPQSSNAQISIQVAPANPQVISAPGITGPVQLNWSYTYTFLGLALGP